jgi:hypothetical protein
MSRSRSTETAEEREQRLKDNARQLQEAEAATEREWDQKVRRNIEQHGP